MEDLIAEWARIAERDARTARAVFDAGDLENTLYLCQQALEKALKAHIQRGRSDLPPRIHNLVHLAEVAELWQELPGARRTLLANLTEYGLVARYGGTVAVPAGMPPADDVRRTLDETEEMVAWLLRKLR